MHKYVISQLTNTVLGIPNFFLQILYTKWPSKKETHFIPIFHLMFTNVSCADVKIMLQIFLKFIY